MTLDAALLCTVRPTPRPAGPLEKIGEQLTRVLSDAALAEVWPRFALALMTDPRYGAERALIGDRARAAAAALIVRLDAAVVGDGPLGVAAWLEPFATGCGPVVKAQEADGDLVANIYPAYVADDIAQTFYAACGGFLTAEIVAKGVKAAGHAACSYAAEAARADGTDAAGSVWVAAHKAHFVWQLYKLDQLINDAQNRDITEACRANERALAHDE